MISNNDVKNITIKTEKCTSEQEDNKGVKLTCVKFDKNDFNNYSLIDSRKILNEDKKKSEEYNSIRFLLDNLYKTNEEILVNYTEKPDFIIKPLNSAAQKLVRNPSA